MAGYHHQGKGQQYWHQQGTYQHSGYSQQSDYNLINAQQREQHGVMQQQWQQQRYPRQQTSYAAPQYGRQQQQHTYYTQNQRHAFSDNHHTPNPRPSKRLRGPDQPVAQPQRLQQQSQQLQQQLQPHSQKLWQQPHQPLKQQLQQQQRQTGASSATGQLPRSTHHDPTAAAWLDQLQDQIAAFAARAVPTPQEQALRDEALQAFRNVAAEALPDVAQGMSAELFGSGAAGLALHTSDLDIVLRGVAETDAMTGLFEQYDKTFVVQCLRKLERAARWGPGKHSLGVEHGQLIARARVPVLKLNLTSGLEMDVSINGDDGIKAAGFLKSFQQDYSVVQPLTLLLKSCLKQRQLADVATGGLGSWSLVNMVIAHLMMMDKEGAQVDHLGSMLLSFLQRYGVDFDRDKAAVAVKLGGIVDKSALHSKFKLQPGKLALEDPLTGREVAGGSHRYADVAETFGILHQRLFDSLAAAQQQHGSNCSKDAGGGTAQQGRTGSSSSSSSSRRRVFDDDADEWGYDAANRSPTYQASIMRKREANGGNSSKIGRGTSGFSILDLLLDTKRALHRQEEEEAAAAAGVEEQQYKSSAVALLHGRQRGGGQWQWGDGRTGAAAAVGHNPHTGVGFKRGRW